MFVRSNTAYRLATCFFKTLLNAYNQVNRRREDKKKMMGALEEREMRA